MISQFTDLQMHWTPIAPILTLRNDADYDAAVERLNALLDVVGTDEKHPLYGLLDTLGTLIHSYEEEHHPIPDAAAPESLQFLMDEHELTSADLPELGTQQFVERYLAGMEELSIDQVRTLSKRFKVSPATFI